MENIIFKSKVKDEEGNLVNLEYLKDLFNISSSLIDFGIKVNHGITNEKSFVSYSNDHEIIRVYKHFKSLK